MKIIIFHYALAQYFCMFALFEKMFTMFDKYPKAFEIHEGTDITTMRLFLSLSPEAEFKKLDQYQVRLLQQHLEWLPKANSNARQELQAWSVLMRRQKEIQKEEEMRSNGKVPKIEQPFPSSKTHKISSFFRSKKTRDNSKELVDNMQAFPLKNVQTNL